VTLYLRVSIIPYLSAHLVFSDCFIVKFAILWNIMFLMTQSVAPPLWEPQISHNTFIVFISAWSEVGPTAFFTAANCLWWGPWFWQFWVLKNSLSVNMQHPIEKPTLCTTILRMTGKREVQLGHRYLRCGFLVLWAYLSPPPPHHSFSYNTRECVQKFRAAKTRSRNLND
jgi:hypothetical protein